MTGLTISTVTFLFTDIEGSTTSSSSSATSFTPKSRRSRAVPWR
jgi:hypothetical protein